MTLISQVQLTGFRNFKDATIRLTQKALVVGANDVGKSNLVHALRLLLDKSLSEADIEPLDSDFYAHEDTHDLSIVLTVSQVTEDCILATMREHVSDDGTLFLAYRAHRDPSSRHKTHSILAGRSADDLVQLKGRYYLRALNIRYIGGRRDLHAYIRRERRELLEDAREARSDKEKTQDDIAHLKISTDLAAITNTVTGLSYVSAAAKRINAELAQLSHHHTKQEVAFDATPADPADFVEQVDIVSKVHGRSLPLTGDGRANQVHFALWSAREHIAASSDPLEVSMFCIEEPEAHLHPHQQRRLAGYLANKLDAQVMLTTHSAQIACEFAPGSIVRLFDSSSGTKVAGHGCSPFIDAAVIEFGYRMGIISAEALFASVVFLVEGPSEEMLFKALASSQEMSFDQLNVTILTVSGIGFRAYGDFLASLAIPFVLRTDNDISKIPRSSPVTYRMAGAERCIKVCREFNAAASASMPVLLRESELTGFQTSTPPQGVADLVQELRLALAETGIFLGDKDLEWDLWHGLAAPLAEYYGADDANDVVHEMQRAKADNMFAFLHSKSASLAALKGHSLCAPLTFIEKLVKAL